MKTLQHIFSRPCRLATKAVAILAIGAATVTMTPQADAVLIDLGATTHDDATGLEWLDLTATQGISANQALLTSYVTTDGFRHATSDEVSVLFANAGFVTGVSTKSPLNDPAANLLLGLLGETQFAGTINATGRGFAIWSTSPSSYTRPFFSNGGLGSLYAVVSGLTSNKDQIDATAGHFLVRDFATSVSDSGSSLLLISLALFALHRGRRVLRIR